MQSLDPTVSGSVGPAKQAKLGFMVGGNRAALQKAEPIPLAMGETRLATAIWITPAW